MRKGLMQDIADNLAAPQGFEPQYADQNLKGKHFEQTNQ
jgi:hypothetical protein